jgi:hypothetical protein
MFINDNIFIIYDIFILSIICVLYFIKSSVGNILLNIILIFLFIIVFNFWFVVQLLLYFQIVSFHI